MGHGNESAFHSKCREKPLDGFKQGDIRVIRSGLQNPSGCWVETDNRGVKGEAVGNVLLQPRWGMLVTWIRWEQWRWRVETDSKCVFGSRMVLDEGSGMGRKGKEEWMTPQTLAGCFVSSHVVPMHGPCLLFSVF